MPLKACLSSKLENRAVILLPVLKGKQQTNRCIRIFRIIICSSRAELPKKMKADQNGHQLLPMRKDAIKDLVYCDRRIQMEAVVKTKNFSYCSVSTFLNDHLCMRNLKALWVSKSISEWSL